jgi:hypothetical protein
VVLPEPACPASTWTETSEHIRARAPWTERARLEACRRVGEDGHAVAQVAAAFGVGWATVMAAVRDHGTPLVDDPDRLDGSPPSAWTRPRSWPGNAAHPTAYVTGIVDVAAPAARRGRGPQRQGPVRLGQ